MLKKLGLTLAALLLVMNIAYANDENPGTYATGSATEIYAVIFGITVGLDERIENIRMAKVIDPLTGSTEAVNIPVPEIYIDSAKKLIETKEYKAKVKDGVPQEFFTYFYYDPIHPEIVITEIKE